MPCKYNYDVSSQSLAELFDLSGRVAVVTGGAKGIGIACVERLAEAGADIAILDIDADAVDHALEKINAKYEVQVIGIAVDMSDYACISAAIAQIKAKMGKIDIWVNNAGIFPIMSALDISNDDYDKLMGLNQRGMFLSGRDAAKIMLENDRGGVIINMISVSALIAATNSAHYVAAKHAINGMTKAFARDLAPHGIRVIAVAPTLITTPGVEAGIAKDAAGKAALEEFINRIPLGRAGMPDDVARVVLFAASDLSSFMTGSVLLVDGGELVL